MPIYEYVCQDCKARFDALRSMAQADDPIACQECGGKHTSRALSLFFAQSDGKVVAGGGDACTSCTSSSCSSCTL
ncbi:MAG: zinc ribbon domain-containing protein [Anaerolineales bacterium]|jgi:putative FmdB family regulatory protein